MFSSGRLRSPRSLIALIFATTVVPLAVLLWLGWRLLEQDRMLEGQQVQERVERAADLIIGALQRALASSEQRLAAGSEDWPEGAVAVNFRSEHAEAHPAGRLAYLPAVESLPEASPELFANAEDLEFRHRERAAAIRAYRELADSADLAVRAAALLRLGRNLAAADRTGEALSTYGRLTGINNVAIGGVPAALNGRYARCRLLEKEGRLPELKDEAKQLAGDLRAGRWPLAGPVYWLYAGDATRWSGAESPGKPQAETLAAAADALWDRHATMPPSGRESLRIGTETLAVLWQSDGDSFRALLATQEFAESEWLAPLEPLASEQRVALLLRDGEGNDIFGKLGAPEAPAATRTAQAAALPWTVITASVDPPGQDAAFALRRRLLIAGFLLLVAMAMLASYVIFRSVSRELAVARLQSDFVAAVSHEFRTPLTSMRQFTDMLRENDALSDERRHICYEAQSRATDRLARLVESLLDFGRMEAGQRRYRFEQRDCGELVSGVVEEFRSEAQAAGHEVKLSADGSAMIETDSEALSRALWNLLDNAVKYSPGRHSVEVGVHRRNGDVLIAVEDHGIGIPAGERKQIFAKFQRGEQARTKGIKGTGIGLAMVDEIVRAHRGRVEVESEPGKGSRFTIVLPAKG
jgi:signal transduction histidine kinase